MVCFTFQLALRLEKIHVCFSELKDISAILVRPLPENFDCPGRKSGTDPSGFRPLSEWTIVCIKDWVNVSLPSEISRCLWIILTWITWVYISVTDNKTNPLRVTLNWAQHFNNRMNALTLGERGQRDETSKEQQTVVGMLGWGVEVKANERRTER